MTITTNASQAQHPPAELGRSLRSRHVAMIAIGGIIGAGLFVGSSTSISTVGPAVIITYAISGLVILMIMRMLSEMAMASPRTGSFTEFVRLGLGHGAGFVAGWLYWYFWVVVVPVEAIAGAVIIRQWLPQFEVWEVGTALLALMTGVNLLSTRSYGEVEFWLSSTKVAAIIVFILLGAAWAFGFTSPVGPTFANLPAYGGFAPNGYDAVLAGVTSVIAAFGRIWVANGIDDTIVALDPATGRRDGTAIGVAPGRPVSLAADERSVWVGVRARGGSQVLKLNPAKHTIDARLPIAYGIQAVAAGGGDVWVLERAKQQLLRIAIADGARTTYVVPKETAAIAYGEGAVWLTSDDTNAVHRIDTGSGAASDIAVGREPKGIAVATSGVWVANQLDDTVTRIDLKTGRVVGDPIPVPRNPFAIAADGGEVWVTSLADSRVTRIRVPPG